MRTARVSSEDSVSETPPSLYPSLTTTTTSPSSRSPSLPTHPRTHAPSPFSPVALLLFALCPPEGADPLSLRSFTVTHVGPDGSRRYAAAHRVRAGRSRAPHGTFTPASAASGGGDAPGSLTDPRRVGSMVGVTGVRPPPLGGRLAPAHRFRLPSRSLTVPVCGPRARKRTRGRALPPLPHTYKSMRGAHPTRRTPCVRIHHMRASAALQRTVRTSLLWESPGPHFPYIMARTPGPHARGLISFLSVHSRAQRISSSASS